MDNSIFNKKTYRADIDGLRAIAVLGVVLYHAGLGIPGGYVGVDIFFVISGFLITGLIIKDLERGTFSMLGFWERRARRIFPALAVMVIACLIAGYFLLLPFGYLVLAQSAIALALFSSNIQFWRTTEYFNPSAEENPLLHTWSLSVEEQFYLIFPLIIAGIFVWKGKKLLLPSVLIGVIFSLFLSVYWLRVEPRGAFYLLPNRAWELGMGSFVALSQPLRSQILRQIFGVTGFSLIVISYWLYDSSTLFPGIAALLPVLGAAAIIWSGMRCDEGSTLSHAHRVLAWGPLVWIGLLSYSLYLWHWPFFAFHRYLIGRSPGVMVSVFYILLSFILSILSLKFVETPFRKRKLCPTRTQILTGSCAVTILMLSLSFLIYKNAGLPVRVSRSVLQLDSQGIYPFAAKDIHDLPSGLRIQKIGSEKTMPKILIWGDSHADVIIAPMNSICNELGIAAIAATKAARPPVFGWSLHRKTTAAYGKCLLGEAELRSLIDKNKSLQHVILVAHWTYCIPNNMLNTSIVTNGFPDALVNTVKELQNSGMKVTIMKEVPVFQSHVAKTVALHEWLGMPSPLLSKTQYMESRIQFEKIYKRLNEEAPGIEFIDPAPFFLNVLNSFDFMDSDKTLLYRDEHHLTFRGASRLKSALKNTIIR